MSDALNVDAILAPVPGPSPGGSDIEFSSESLSLEQAVRTVQARAAEPRDAAREMIRQARLAEKDSKPGAEQMMRDAERGNQPARLTSIAIGLTEWTDVENAAVRILTTKSKDLPTAIQLAEALTSSRAFEGLLDGLIVIRRLIDEYWEMLFPPLKEGLGATSRRVALLARMDRQLPLTIAALPLTGPKYTIQHFHKAALRGTQGKAAQQEGWPSTQQVQKALGAMPAAARDALEDLISACERELQALVDVCRKRFADEAPKFAEMERALLECRTAVCRPDRHATVGVTGLGLQKKDGDPKGRPHDSREAPDDVDGGLPAGSGLEALRAAHETCLAARTGRERFLTQLEFAELCSEAGLDIAAYGVLEQLGSIADNRSLQLWEDAAVLIRMWSALDRAGKTIGAIREVRSDITYKISALIPDSGSQPAEPIAESGEEEPDGQEQA